MGINFLQILIVLKSLQIKLTLLSFDFISTLTYSTTQFSYSLDCSLNQNFGVALIYTRAINVVLA